MSIFRKYMLDMSYVWYKDEKKNDALVIDLCCFKKILGAN